MLNSALMCAIELFWSLVNIGSGDGFVLPATIRYLNQTWLSFVAPYGVITPQWVNANS